MTLCYANKPRHFERLILQWAKFLSKNKCFLEIEDLNPLKIGSKRVWWGGLFSKRKSFSRKFESISLVSDCLERELPKFVSQGFSPWIWCQNDIDVTKYFNQFLLFEPTPKKPFFNHSWSWKISCWDSKFV